MTTRMDMVQAGRDACKLNVQYVYGAKPSNREFRTYSLEEIRELRSYYGANVWTSDDNKAGSLCCDCSGLLTKATGRLVGSAMYRAEASTEVGIGVVEAAATDPAAWARYVGWALYMPGHIGIVSDVPGYYYAMDGSGRNAVHYPLALQGWTCAFPVAGVDYDYQIGELPMEFLGRSNTNEPLCYFTGMSYRTVSTQEQSEAIQALHQVAYGTPIPMIQSPAVAKLKAVIDGK